MTSVATPLSALFAPLEQTVIRIARRERGTGCLPESAIGKLLVALGLAKRIAPLADPRLETLRCFINRAHNRRTRRKDIEALARVGYTRLQIEAVSRG